MLKTEPKLILKNKNNIIDSDVSVILERAFEFLENGYFTEAEIYYEKALDINSKCYQAYLGKLMTEYKIKRIDELKNCDDFFIDNENYKNIIRYGDENIIEELMIYVKIINKKNEDKLFNKISYELKNIKSRFKMEKYIEEIKQFPQFNYSDEFREKCLNEISECEKEITYNEAQKLMDVHNLDAFKRAIEKFESIKNQKDVNNKIEYCKKMIEEGNVIDENEEIDIEKEIENNLKEERKEQKRFFIELAIVMITIIIFFVIDKVFINPKVYSNNYVNKNNQEVTDVVTSKDTGNA